jgi:uncharacterized Zn finger protein
MRNFRRYGDFYTESQPKKVQGGIKAQNRKGAFAKTWWGKRWIEVLENFEIGKRLARGKRYARSGQVVNLDVTKGRVKAKVQGSRVKPYDVLIENDTFPDEQWQQVITDLSGQPRFVSSLLSGEMPKDIEEVFLRTGLSLFPGEEEFRFACSCPDHSSPCKHIAAVFYLLAEAFDEDPFLIFRLRGMEKDELISSLQADLPENAPQTTGERVQLQALPEDPKAFWWGMKAFEAPKMHSKPVDTHASLPKRLGSLPFWRSERPFFEIMETLYKQASSQAINKIEEKL